MPNPKTGTVTDDTAKAIKEVKAGRVEFKLDKNGNVSVPVGKASFTPAQLVENGTAVIDAVSKARPSSAKGKFIHSITFGRDHVARPERGHGGVSSRFEYPYPAFLTSSDHETRKDFHRFRLAKSFCRRRPS